MKNNYININVIRESFIPAIIFLIFWVLGIVFSKNLILLLNNIAPDQVAFMQTYPAETAITMIKIALFSSLYFSLPVISYYFLKDKIKKYGFDTKKELITFLITAFFIAITGFLFAKFLVIPILLYFFVGLSDKLVTINFDAGSYISFCLQILFLTTLIAEIPVFIYFIIKSDFKQKFPSFHSQIMPISIGISVLLLSNEIVAILFLALIIFAIVILTTYLSELF